MYTFNNAFYCWLRKKIQCWPNINFWSAIIPKSVWNIRERIRKQRFKENSFEAGLTSHLYELPRFQWSFYVFKWSSWSARNHSWKRSSSTHALRFSHLKDISGLPYCFKCALCNNNCWRLRMSIARSDQCQHVLLKKFTVFLKFKFLKKLRYSVIFFLSQPELAYAHWRVDRRVDDEKKYMMVEHWRYEGEGTQTGIGRYT